MRLYIPASFMVIFVVQSIAIWDGISHAFNLSFFLQLTITFLITCLPGVGTVAGVYGSVAVWDWNIMASFLLLGSPYILAVLIMAIEEFGGRATTN